MADDKIVKDPAKAAPARATMAPAARPPSGASDDTAATRDLERLSDRELAVLEVAVRAEVRRRARVPDEPSFGISEGTRAELEQHGEAVSPFTGQKITGDGGPRDKGDRSR